MNTVTAHWSFATERVWHTHVNGIRLGGIRAEIKNDDLRGGKLRDRVRGDVPVSREDLDARFCASGERDGDGLLSGGDACGHRWDRDRDHFGAAAGAPVLDVETGDASRSARVDLRSGRRDSKSPGGVSDERREGCRRKSFN